MPLTNVRRSLFATALCVSLGGLLGVSSTLPLPSSADQPPLRTIGAGGERDTSTAVTSRQSMQGYRAGEKTVRFFSAEVSEDQGAGGQDAAGQGGMMMYEISRDGHALRTTHIRNTIHLRYATFDPLLAEPSVPAGFTMPVRDRGGEGVYIVQFHTQPLGAYRTALEAHGGVIHQFLPHQSYVVRLSHDAVDAVRAEPFVRWVGPFHPADRVEPEVFEVLVDDPAKLPPTRYNIMVFERGLAQKQIVAGAALAQGGEVNAMIPDGFILEATLDGEQLQRVLQMPEVHYVDRWSPFETDMNIAREISGADHIENTLGFTGQGVRAEVCDSNLLLSHVDFQSNPPIPHGSLSGNAGHGTSVFGIVFGDGTNSANARGMMPDAQGIFASYGNLSNRYQHTARLLEAPYFAVFQTNSWGSARTTQYTTISAQMDDILLLNDITILNSQSNAGNQNSRPQAWAKNVVSGGGVRHYNTLTKNDDAWAGGASIGPAADGRIKPDLTHFYDNIRTTSSSGGYTNTFGGTSGATPIIAGHFGLMFQMWHEGVFGNETDPNGTVFTNRPRAATAKALMINSAVPYPFTSSSSDLIRVHQGWGMPDLESLLSRVDGMHVTDGTMPLENLATSAYIHSVDPNTPVLRATLVYTDPAGSPSASIHRINDLSLRVVSPSGTVYWGNHGLMQGVWSAEGGSEDSINTVENVFIQNPEPGDWVFEILASEVNEDANLDTPLVEATYAFVVSGIAPPFAVAEIDEATVTFGTLLDGTKEDLLQDDDNTLTVRSVFGFSVIEPNLTELRIDATTAGIDRGEMQFQIRSWLDTPGGRVRLRMRNWTNGQYPLLMSQPVDTTPSHYIVEDIDPTLFINAAGQVEARVRHSAVATFSLVGFRAHHDLVRIETR